MSSPIMQAIKQISDEKNIPVESVVETIEAALAAAYRKDFGSREQNIKAKFDPEEFDPATLGGMEVFDVKTVVEDMELLDELEEGSEAPVAAKPLVEASLASLSDDSEELIAVESGEVVAKEKKEGKKAKKGKKAEQETEEAVEPAAAEVPAEAAAPAVAGEEVPEAKRFNPKTEIMVSQARETLKPDAEVGEEIWTKLDVPDAFGRMAAQTAKQVIIQKIRDAEYSQVYEQFKDKERSLVTATVQRVEGRNVLFDLGQAAGMMPPEEQVQGERYAPGDRLKVFITEVRSTSRGPSIIVSRTHPEIVRRLFETEIPEISAGIVEIKGVAREAGSRSKVAVASTQDNVDPIGACIGQRGTRIQTIISELGGEKVDIILFDEDPVSYIANALSPAKVVEIALDEDDRIAEVIVNQSQLSLAIGRGGQNVRLASKLTGWRINIKDLSEVSGGTVAIPGEEEDAEAGPAVEPAVAEAEGSGEEPAAAEENEAPAAVEPAAEEVVPESAEEADDAGSEPAEEAADESAEPAADEEDKE